jgi:hypothetical protein
MWSIAAAFIVTATAAVGSDQRDQGILGPENWPVTVEDTVRDLLPRIPLIEKLKVKSMSRKYVISLHSEMGLGIRNRYGLWRGNDKLIHSACGSPCHPDDASMKIIEAMWDEMHK